MEKCLISQAAQREIVINEVIGVLLELANLSFTVDIHMRIVNPGFEPPAFS